MKYTNKKRLNKNNNNNNNNNNKTKKCNFKSYYPFENEYSKTLSKKNLKLSNKKNIKKFIQLLELKKKPKVLPENDFYTFINYTWLEDKSFDAIQLNKEQKYITQIDSFRLIQDKVALELADIINEYTKNNNTTESNRLKNFFNSVLTLNPIQNTKKIIKETIDKIDELRKDKNNLWKMLAFANKFTFCKEQAPFCWNINYNLNDTTKFMAYLNPHNLPLIDTSVYETNNINKENTENTENNEKYINKFIKYTEELFDTTLDKNHNLDPKVPFKITQQFYNFLSCNDKNIIENPVGFNVITKEEALNKYKFNWEEFCKELGYKKIPSKFCCTSLNYLKCCTEYLLENWNSEEMKSYWHWLFIRQFARFTDKWIYIFWRFYGKYSKGQEALYPKHMSLMIFTSYPFCKLLSKLYVEKYYDESIFNFVKGLAEDLKQVFIRVLKRNDWLDKSTKKNAIYKLEKLKFILTQSDNMIDDPDLDYDSTNLLDNMIKISEWNTKKYIELTNKDFIDLPLMYWSSFPAALVGKQSYVVNAYYIPQQNSMFIPLGYMQKPFVDLDNRGIEYNLSQIGFTIAHEFSHSLDTTGSQYDYLGNLNNWWSNKDKIIYGEIQKNIMMQYKDWTERDGLDYNPYIGIEEDIADISGLAICEEYLRDYQLNHKTILIVRQISFEAFYVYFAYQNRQKISKRALLVELKTNPHPLVKYRTNIPLSRSEIFVVNYDIKKGDGMYWSDKSIIW